MRLKNTSSDPADARNAGVNTSVRAVLFDFGGVVSESPFLAFHRFERQRGLPEGFLQRINRNNPDDNAWARYERSELTPEAFDEAFAAESRAAGHEVRGLDVIDLLFGPIRPQMTAAVTRCRRHFVTACLTNNVRHGGGRGLDAMPSRAREWSDALALFDRVIESSRLGQRKPEPRFFEEACRALGVEPSQAVFLDDLGTNLKPAREMGMVTIKVTDADAALAELETVLGIPLR
jgi:putative hydrolase of the HAD superfamily